MKFSTEETGASVTAFFGNRPDGKCVAPQKLGGIFHAARNKVLPRGASQLFVKEPVQSPDAHVEVGAAVNRWLDQHKEQIDDPYEGYGPL